MCFSAGKDGLLLNVVSFSAGLGILPLGLKKFYLKYKILHHDVFVC